MLRIKFVNRRRKYFFQNKAIDIFRTPNKDPHPIIPHFCLFTCMVCSICQCCFSGTSSKLFDLSQNCVLESTEMILPIPNISWNSRIRIQNSTWRHAREQCCTVKCKKNILQILVNDMFMH